jgi:hypothetical protein
LLIIYTQLRSLHLTCLVAGVLHRKAHHGTTHEMKTWLSIRASCIRSYSLYIQYTIGVWRKKCSYQGNLLCSNGQHSHNTSVKDILS